jgi:adhesin transport system outer membrane protein
LGTGAALQAVEAEREAAAAQVNQAREEAERRLRSLDAQIESLRRQEAEARNLARQAAENYEVFAQQLREGQRTVGDVVGLFETKVRTERAAVVIPFDIAKLELRRAAILGTLVDGDRI